METELLENEEVIEEEPVIDDEPIVEEEEPVLLLTDEPSYDLQILQELQKSNTNWDMFLDAYPYVYEDNPLIVLSPTKVTGYNDFTLIAPTSSYIQPFYVHLKANYTYSIDISASTYYSFYLVLLPLKTH